VPLLVRRSSRRLRGTFTSLVCLTDRRRRDFHVPAPPFARVLRALLASSLRSALRIAGPKATPACSSTSVLIIEKGSFARGADVSEPAQIMHFQNKIPSYLTSISQQIAPLPNERRETFYSGKFEMRIILAISQGDIKLQAALLTAGTL